MYSKCTYFVRIKYEASILLFYFFNNSCDNILFRFERRKEHKKIIIPAEYKFNFFFFFFVPIYYLHIYIIIIMHKLSLAFWNISNDLKRRKRGLVLFSWGKYNERVITAPIWDQHGRWRVSYKGAEAAKRRIAAEAKTRHAGRTRRRYRLWCGLFRFQFWTASRLCRQRGWESFTRLENTE